MSIDINQLHHYILRYGQILKDIEFNGGTDRIRIISCDDKLWYDHMCIGNVVECHELKP